MEKIKVGILGASGIGKFHTREFLNAGCDVVAILGSSEESSARTGEMLKSEYGVEVRPYSDLDLLLEKEKLDAVSICTPPSFHYSQTKKCLESDLHVLCEKPFVLNSKNLGFEKANELCDLANRNGKILSVNTQWPSVLESVGKYVSLDDVGSFSMLMEPGFKGVNLLTEAAPHMNSMLIKLLGKGEINNLKYEELNNERVLLWFDYINRDNRCEVKYDIRFKEDRPREVVFSINENEFRRKIGENYKQSLIYDRIEFDIDEPLEVSVSKFVCALNGGKCLVNKEEILENMKMQDLIIKEFFTIRGI
jgi:hypothetical protein